MNRPVTENVPTNAFQEFDDTAIQDPEELAALSARLRPSRVWSRLAWRWVVLGLLALALVGGILIGRFLLN
jgi:hypothetical protein